MIGLLKNVLHVADLLVFATAVLILAVVDHVRRKALTEKERKEFEALASEHTERNISANVAARMIQGGLTVGGFLFVGLFAAVFQPALKPHAGDILCGMAWAVVSLVFGALNLASLLPRSVIKNIALTRQFNILIILQFWSIIAGFCRIVVLSIKHLQLL